MNTVKHPVEPSFDSNKQSFFLILLEKNLNVFMRKLANPVICRMKLILLPKDTRNILATTVFIQFSFI